MKDSCFLVLDLGGIVRMTKRPGSLKRGEVAVRIAVAVADNVFEQPAISASIDIPESAVIRPVVDVQIEDHPHD